ncbi:MAG: hypothetical protein ACRDOI_21810, partial [Trebonia sp.]
MTVSSDATSGRPPDSASPGRKRQTDLVPALADCFTPRPHTGPGQLAALPEGQCVVLVGPPGREGTGKTQLAAHLARTWLTQTPDAPLIWLDAGSRDALLSGYTQAMTAARAGAWPLTITIPADPGSADSAEQTAGRFLAGLAEASGPWLVVLDGLTDPADAEGLWPTGPAGRLLVTAAPGANPVPDDLNPVVSSVGPFSSHEGLTYLMNRLSADPDQRLGAVDLAEELGCHPLALAQASAAIASAGISCRDYHELFLKRREQIVGPAPAAMAVTWTLSVECADEIAPGGAPQVCLAIAALLGSAGIPESIFATRAAAEFATRSPGATDAPGRVRSALASLRGAGLIQVDGGLVFLPQALRTAVLAATPDA